MINTKINGTLLSNKPQPPPRVPFSDVGRSSCGTSVFQSPETCTPDNEDRGHRAIVRVERGLREFLSFLVVLVVGCLVFGAVVWWRLLS